MKNFKVLGGVIPAAIIAVALAMLAGCDSVTTVQLDDDTISRISDKAVYSWQIVEVQGEAYDIYFVRYRRHPVVKSRKKAVYDRRNTAVAYTIHAVSGNQP